jgi:hypothetical protein
MKAQENALLKQIMEEDAKRRTRLVEEERLKEVPPFCVFLNECTTNSPKVATFSEQSRDPYRC